MRVINLIHSGILMRRHLGMRYSIEILTIPTTKFVLIAPSHKVRDRLGTSERNCVELILAEKDDDVIPMLPEEIVNNLQKIKASIQVVIKQHDETYQAAKAQADAILPGDKKTFAILVTKNKDLWTAPFFSMFDGKSINMKDFIQKNRKDGTWGNSFLDKMLELSKIHS